MASIQLSESSLAALKKALRKEFPDVRSSHITEALAVALGFRTHAALLAALSTQATDPAIVLLDDARFDIRLQGFGYPPDIEFSFELLDGCQSLIPTTPLSAYDIEYRSARHKAWRNLMVLAVNEGIRQKLFSLRPDDNRWPGAEPPNSQHRDPGFIFEFTLPDGKPAKGFVSDAGFGELSIHAAVYPKGDWLQATNAVFHAGDSFARGWLERRDGAWLQSAENMFNCRKYLLHSLAEMEAIPMGYGDRGRVIF